MNSFLDGRRAERRARAKLGFLIHASVFAMVIGMLLMINVMTSPAHLWVGWPLVAWSAGLLLHGIAVLVILHGRKMLERLAQRELARYT